MTSEETSPENSTYVVHYSEIALKGKNRPEFVKLLRRNIRRALDRTQSVAHLTHDQGRIFVRTSADEDRVDDALSHVFGISWFGKVSTVPQDYPAILDGALALGRPAPGQTFKVVPRRSDKTFPLNSRDMAVKLGADIVARTGKRVNLVAPDTTIHVDVIKGGALVYGSKSKGLGGLPVGTGGRVIHLFSGGIDSPVAAWLLMKRGCTPVYLHFYLAPTAQSPIESKITKIVGLLSSYSGKATLVLVPFAEYQLATLGAPVDLELSLFRRFMRMTGEVVSSRFGASAISTGDSLAQAASQTIWNIKSFDEGSTLPLLRPLLTYDKEEIISLAKKIGTYDLSLEDYKDCCSMLSNHPRTRVKGTIVSQFAERLGFKELALSSLQSGTLVTVDPAENSTRTTPLADLFKGGYPESPNHDLPAVNAWDRESAEAKI